MQTLKIRIPTWEVMVDKIGISYYDDASQVIKPPEKGPQAWWITDEEIWLNKHPQLNQIITVVASKSNPSYWDWNSGQTRLSDQFIKWLLDNGYGAQNGSAKTLGKPK